jgi:hypothetical protein
VNTCKAVTLKGQPCRAEAIRGEFCAAHDPDCDAKRDAEARLQRTLDEARAAQRELDELNDSIGRLSLVSRRGMAGTVLDEAAAVLRDPASPEGQIARAIAMVEWAREVRLADAFLGSEPPETVRERHIGREAPFQMSKRMR